MLLPYNQPHAYIVTLLQVSRATCLVASAGSLPLDLVCSGASGVKQITWVVEESSKQMDWAGVPDSIQGKATVSVWHDLVRENKDKVSPEVPDFNDAIPGDLWTVWQATRNSSPQLVPFNQQVCCPTKSTDMLKTLICYRTSSRLLQL